MFADLILHVVDISNPEYKNHIAVTNKVLAGLGCESPVVMVYNKIDKVEPEVVEELMADNNAVFISAKSGRGIEELKSKLEKLLF